jgi:glycolate oxidase FAD binding subunit
MTVATGQSRILDLQPFGSVRPGASGDAVDGLVPAVVVEPTSPQDLAGALKFVSTAGLTTIVRGGGTKLGWGRPARGADVLLSTRGLNQVLAHRQGDLTATVQAGARLHEVNAQLARQGQWLPIDTAFDESTIGGIVATNDSGPLRTRYGTPRDLVIGVTIALTDGRLVKAGGHVVKNVAGYDLGRLMSGSFGELAALVDVTLKLLPIPAVSQTIVARYTGPDGIIDDIDRVSRSQLEPTAYDVGLRPGGHGDGSLSALVRFATSPEATAAQVAEALRLMTGGSAQIVTGADESAVWADQVRRPWSGMGAVVRLSWLPAGLRQVMTLLDVLSGLTHIELTGRATVGAGFVRLDGDDDRIARAVERLRSARDIVSNVVVLGQSTALKGRVDAWGPPVSAAGALRALKKSFDPAGVLNAGRGPI